MLTCHLRRLERSDAPAPRRQAKPAARRPIRRLQDAAGRGPQSLRAVARSRPPLHFQRPLLECTNCACLSWLCHCSTSIYADMLGYTQPVVAFPKQASLNQWSTRGCANRPRRAVESYPRCVSGVCLACMRCVSGETPGCGLLQIVVNPNRFGLRRVAQVTRLGGVQAVGLCWIVLPASGPSEAGDLPCPNPCTNSPAEPENLLLTDLLAAGMKRPS